MSKTIIGPIIAFLIIAAKLIFGIEISQDMGGQITDWIVTGITLGTVVYGIFKNHNKGTGV